MRYGVFNVSKLFVFKHAELLAKALAALEFIPVRVQESINLTCFEYCGFSPRFEEIGKGDMAKSYDIEMKADGSLIVEVGFGHILLWKEHA